MFGFFKKKAAEKANKRKKQRRSNTDPRRAEFRWEPDKTDRRDPKDRRKGGNTWDETNSK
jgi:hypothetical protein